MERSTGVGVIETSVGKKIMINYAVVGAGWISQIAFLPGVAQSGNSRVAAIVTGDRAKAAQLAEFHGVGTIVGYAATMLCWRAPRSMRSTLPSRMTCMLISRYGRRAPASISWSRSRSPPTKTNRLR